MNKTTIRISDTVTVTTYSPNCVRSWFWLQITQDGFIDSVQYPPQQIDLVGNEALIALRGLIDQELLRKRL